MLHRRWWFVLAGFLLIGLGIAAWALLAEAQDGEDNGGVPFVTPDQACVDPADIHFDTFTGGSIPFDQASRRDNLRLRDAIPPIDNPQYGDVSAGAWLAADDPVLGYVAPDGQAYAYPFKIMNYHEIINETFDGAPVLISYCPLCRSGLVFSRALNGQTLTFGNTSALYNADMVMYDHQTGSFWHQVGGAAIVGPLCGQSLDLLPSLTTTWREWQALHPDTLVLTRETGYQRDYSRDPFTGYGARLNTTGRFPFPVTDDARDPRLPPGEIVLGVEIDSARRVYAPGQLGTVAVNDTLAATPIVVFSQADPPAAAAYFSTLDNGRQLHFEVVAEQYVDVQTGSVWQLNGAAAQGELAGTRLEPVPARSTYWFALVATYPDVTLYPPPASAP